MSYAMSWNGKMSSDLFIHIEFIEAMWRSERANILILSRLDKGQIIKTNTMMDQFVNISIIDRK